MRHAAEVLDDVIQLLDDVISQRGEDQQLVEPGDKVPPVSMDFWDFRGFGAWDLGFGAFMSPGAERPHHLGP